MVDVARSGMSLYYTPHFLEENLAADTADDFLSLMARREIYVAENEGRIVGTAALKDTSIGMVYVDPDFYGAGIGRKLIDHVIQRAREALIPLLTVHASLNSIGFYKSCGFMDIRSEISHADFPARFMQRKTLSHNYTLMYYVAERHESNLHDLKTTSNFLANISGKGREVFVLENADNKPVAILSGSYTYDSALGLNGFILNDVFGDRSTEILEGGILQLAMQLYFLNYRFLQIKEGVCDLTVLSSLFRNIRGTLSGNLFQMQENSLKKFTGL